MSHIEKYKITKTLHYYGYPEARSTYKVLGDHNGIFMALEINWYGCHGWDIPKIINKTCNNGYNNGYFWEMIPFVRNLFNRKLNKFLHNMRENETITLLIDVTNETISVEKKEQEND